MNFQMLHTFMLATKPELELFALDILLPRASNYKLFIAHLKQLNYGTNNRRDVLNVITKVMSLYNVTKCDYHSA